MFLLIFIWEFLIKGRQLNQSRQTESLTLYESCREIFRYIFLYIDQAREFWPTANSVGLRETNIGSYRQDIYPRGFQFVAVMLLPSGTGPLVRLGCILCVCDRATLRKLKNVLWREAHPDPLFVYTVQSWIRSRFAVVVRTKKRINTQT